MTQLSLLNILPQDPPKAPQISTKDEKTMNHTTRPQIMPGINEKPRNRWTDSEWKEHLKEEHDEIIPASYSISIIRMDPKVVRR